jgi:hypothetical protein
MLWRTICWLPTKMNLLKRRLRMYWFLLLLYILCLLLSSIFGSINAAYCLIILLIIRSLLHGTIGNRWFLCRFVIRLLWSFNFLLCITIFRVNFICILSSRVFCRITIYVFINICLSTCKLNYFTGIGYWLVTELFTMLVSFYCLAVWVLAVGLSP